MDKSQQTSFLLPNLTDLLLNVPADSIVSRTVFDDDNVRVLLFGFAPGQELSEHTSSHAAILHFLSGTADVTLGEKGVTAVAGTWVHMPPRLPHSITAHDEVRMLLLMLKG